MSNPTIEIIRDETPVIVEVTGNFMYGIRGSGSPESSPDTQDGFEDIQAVAVEDTFSEDAEGSKTILVDSGTIIPLTLAEKDEAETALLEARRMELND